MCGIAGIIQTRTEGPSPERLLAERMTEQLRHRGPDDGDVFVDEHVALGHRRLAIIDVATGHQPIFNEDGAICVVFNGEIYNFREVAKELCAAGHRFHTSSDTEVIVHAWEQWGQGCVERFRGMFAFVLWDRRARTAFLARDRLGVKPLYYALLPDGQFLFGSELKAITEHPGFGRRVDAQAVEDYFALGYVPDPKTIYIDARKLPPAHTMTLHIGARLPAPRRYWRPVYEPKHRLTAAAAIEQLEALLEESVKLRLISEVPLGAFLSGGVDSSIVVAKMAQLSGRRIRTFSIGFEEAKYDETRYACMVAEQYDTDHSVDRISVDDQSIIDRVLALYDEPFADSSALATWRVCEAARRHVTVALSGDGGDEAFGGYRRYRMHLAEECVRSRVPARLRRTVFGAVGSLYPKVDWLPRLFRAKTTLQALGQSEVAAYFGSVSCTREELRTSLYSPEFQRELGGYRAEQVFQDCARDFEGEAPLDLLHHIDLQTWLPGDINTKIDRASMAHSLEVRDPLLDHRLIEWGAQLPQSLRTTLRDEKVVLKQLAARLLPGEVLDRPKQGFSIPVAEWLRKDLGGALEAQLRVMDEGSPIRADVCAKALDSHRRGVRDYGRPLWAVHAFCCFLMT